MDGVQTKFVVDTVMPLSRVLTSETQGVTTHYVYGTGLISQENDGQWLFYHFNNIGSTEAVTDLDGDVVERFEYGPYGELISENSHGIIFLYNGEYGVSTDENGLYYMRARYYNPEIKRFINQDVIIGTIMDSPTMNRYAYVEGNPISLADPFGLSPQTNWFKHSVLDVLGMIPAFGFLFDIENALLYAVEGDWFGCVTSIISALPGLGDAVGGALKLLDETSSVGCAIIKIGNVAGNSGKLIKGSYVIGNVVDDNIERYMINGEDFNWGQFGIDVLTVAFEVLAMKGAWSDLKNAQALPVCFIAGTLVTMADGEKPIEEVEVGDEVLAMDYETGEVAVKKVTQTFENESSELVHINVNGEKIVATPEHPFYVAKLGWTSACKLRAGDVLVLSNGEYVVVEFIQHEILESPVKVYNFEVEDYHTYFVGESSVLVHNDCPEKTYQTYTKTNPDTGEVYSGRTSGTGSDKQNIKKRDANHHMTKKGFGEAELDKSSSNRQAIRGREQMLIDFNGGSKSSGGTSGNAINGISPFNPNKKTYIDKARKLFGEVK